MFPEVSEAELIRLLFQSEGVFAVYFYTPWCGTCRYGERMLSVVKTMAADAVIYKSNVNFLPTIVPDWKIESVPCLAIVENKRIVEKLYSMQSVPFLLEKVRAKLVQ